MSAQTCDACGRMLYGVERVALFVAGQPRVERDLCRGCRTDAIDGFLRLPDVPASPSGARYTGVGSKP